MLCDGEWGDHVELTAMSEMYERPIEIYAYKREPYKVAPEWGIVFYFHLCICRAVFLFLVLFEFLNPFNHYLVFPRPSVPFAL